MPPGQQLLVNLLQLYSYVLLARVVLSWVPSVNRAHPVIQLVYQLTEPVLDPVRRALPPMGGFDLSPLIVFFALHLIRGVIVGGGF